MSGTKPFACVDFGVSAVRHFVLSREKERARKLSSRVFHVHCALWANDSAETSLKFAANRNLFTSKSFS